MTDPVESRDHTSLPYPEIPEKASTDPQKRKYSTESASSVSPRLPATEEFFSAFRTSPTPSKELPPDDSFFLSLGCSKADALILTAHGFVSVYEEFSSSLPREVAESVVCAIISQQPYISEDLRLKITPIRPESGTSGVYFLKDFNGTITSVFKPEDEEQYLDACPHYAMFSGEAPLDPDYPIRLSIKKGRATQNEIASSKIAKNIFNLDVPETFFVAPSLFVHRDYIQIKARGSRPEKRVPVGPIILSRFDTTPAILVRKPGSIQLFKPGIPAIDIRSSAKIQSDLIPFLYTTRDEALNAFERLYIFDFIIGNTDRNLGNLLFNTEKRTMHPIDHGACLPDGLSLSSFRRRGCFINETTPLHFSVPIDDPTTRTMREATKLFCSTLDSSAIEIILKEEGLEESVIQEIHLRTSFLKICVDNNLSLSTIRSFFREARESTSDGSLCGKSPLLEVATRAAMSLGITKESLPSEKEALSSLYSLFLEEFKRQTALYIESFMRK